MACSKKGKCFAQCSIPWGQWDWYKIYLLINLRNKHLPRIRSKKDSFRPIHPPNPGGITYTQSKDQTWTLGSRESLTLIIRKTSHELFVRLDFQVEFFSGDGIGSPSILRMGLDSYGCGFFGTSRTQSKPAHQTFGKGSLKMKIS